MRDAPKERPCSGLVIKKHSFPLALGESKLEKLRKEIKSTITGFPWQIAATSRKARHRYMMKLYRSISVERSNQIGLS